ncbi:MAG: hypothetical protein FJ217_09270 [Ignavibacteria bacterium]|nr:hypothetical protein [Ignavibacteria bacterium]
MRRKTNIDGNLLRATIFNYGFAGRTGVVPDEVPFEWPKNTYQHYVALVALFVGGEVVDKNREKVQILDAPNYRQSPQGSTWNMEPIPGYLRPDEKSKIAKSDDASTWPDFWPDKLKDPIDPGWKGSWNGYFGKDQFNADQEMYYKASDDKYDRFKAVFSPDSTDNSRAGLGIILDVRAMQWSQVLVNDVLFLIHSVTNDGTTNIDRFAVTLWLADMVGGDGDTQDDISYFDLLSDIAWMTDYDNRGNAAFGNTKVGVAAITYLETPGNAVDHIDNDGDGERNSPKVTGNMIRGEVSGDGIDNNGNGLVDEDSTHIAFGTQVGVGFADRIDNDRNGELGSPVVTSAMLSGEIQDNAIDDNNNGAIDEGSEDVGRAFKDGIDNNGDGEEGSPVITQAMVDTAAKYGGRLRLTNGRWLYAVGTEDLGKKYADGIDNDKDGAIDEGIDEGIDEMIDESRQDGIDNDGDWNPIMDDVGLDGKPGTNDFGEGDGKPTSGYQSWGPNGALIDTGLPGEPNIDKTDVSESDQIGITNVQYLPPGPWATTADQVWWAKFMTPGSFYDPALTRPGEYDLFVSSGFFPLRSGQTERISVAVVMGADVNDAIANKDRAQQTYNEDYQFAKAPVAPTVTAVAGDRRVTLYWDSKAEQSYDKYLAALGQPGYDFEGYRIYRATDPAFQDAYKVTDADGNLVYYKPIAQFDKANHVTGLHPVSMNGAHFNLGSDTGLRHEFVDTTVQNGQAYYYAVTAYDFGWTGGGISPAESPISISVTPGGGVQLGRNVVKITPEAPVAGYKPPQINTVVHTRGNSSGQIHFTLVDPNSIKDNNRYRITFKDTLIRARTLTQQDTLKTKSFTLINITNPSRPDTLLSDNTKIGFGDEAPVVDGFRLSFVNESNVSLHTDLSRWSRPKIYPMTMQPFNIGAARGTARPADYKIIFGPVGTDTSLGYFPFAPLPIFPMPATPVNFKVYNTTENRQIKFAFRDVDTTGGPGVFSVGKGVDESDVIGFFEKDARDSLVLTWRFNVVYDAALSAPRSGDTAYIVLRKPFVAEDVYEFTTVGHKVDKELAASSLDKIKVVPNPYLAAATWEPRNPYASGRGPRSIHFNHLPQQCTIRIYSVSGELVATIEHNSALLDGSAEWNLLSRDNLPVSYGVYIYHIDAPGVGEKVGRFAIIK